MEGREVMLCVNCPPGRLHTSPSQAPKLNVSYVMTRGSKVWRIALSAAQGKSNGTWTCLLLVSNSGKRGIIVLIFLPLFFPLLLMHIIKQAVSAIGKRTNFLLSTGIIRLCCELLVLGVGLWWLKTSCSFCRAQKRWEQVVNHRCCCTS